MPPPPRFETDTHMQVPDSRDEQERELRLRELDAFAARVAHDLKNPLSPCMLAIGVLRKQRGLDDAGQRSIERAEAGLKRAVGSPQSTN